MEKLKEQEGKDYERKYNHCKTIVLKWELAFSREKGQQPTKDDFAIAPRPVQVAYITYLQIKRLLAKINSSDFDKVELNFRKPRPVESPAKIFHRSKFNGKECVEEYDPVLEKSLCSDGPPISPRKPPVVSPRLLQVLPHLKFIRTPSQGKTKFHENAPFCRLNSKLLLEEIESSSNKDVRIPRGKLVSQSPAKEGNGEVNVESFEFSKEIDSILIDVRKAVENYDQENFDDDKLLSETDDFGLKFGHTPVIVPSVKTSIAPPLQSTVEYCEKRQNLHSKKVSFKSRATNKDWIDRCVLDDTRDEINELTSKDESGQVGQFLNIDIATHIQEKTLPSTSIESRPVQIPSPIESNPITVSSSPVTIEVTQPCPNVEDGKLIKSGKRRASSTRSNIKIKASKVINKVIVNKEQVPGEKRKAAEVSEYDFIDDISEGNGSCHKPRKRARIMRQKKADENFVRIDLTKKVFVRGKKKITGILNKRQNWKLKKKEVAAENKIKLLKCRKCGEVGHFAKYCMKELSNLESKAEEIDDSPFPTLEEAARMIQSKRASEASKNRSCIYTEPPKAKEEKDELSRNNILNVTDDCDEQFVEATLALVENTIDFSSQHLKEPNLIEIDSQESFSASQLPNTESHLIDSTSTISFNSLERNESQDLNPFRPVFTTEKSEDVLNETDSKLIEESLNVFGYKDFRHGQKEGIIRVLRGDSTLVVLSTGSGKSLCYLLPAYIYSKKYPGSMAICVSPLVSLMEDQVQSIPSFLSGACLHTNMSQKQRDVVVEKVRNKKLQILLVSPEAVCGGMFGLLRNVHEFPPISFACIDEIHCVSEWSHNFRPSYLRVCQILRQRLNVKTIIGLTATATNSTIQSICSHLNIESDSVIRGEIIPTNLRLSCSRDLNREDALLILLRSKRFEGCDSIIIYCTRREQCDKIATLIRTMLMDTSQGIIKENSRRRISSDCETYHAGMSSARRKSVQNNFMAGKIRIVVATVAFGMGIDKSNIRAVIHYNMPKTFESYIQEIGRAGRDGLPAECHLFLDNNKGKDICELKRHIYSNSIERTSLRKLLSRIFKACTCQRTEKILGLVTDLELSKSALKSSAKCRGHEISFSVDETVRALDLGDENIETIFCYLERFPDKKLIEILPKCYHKCSVQSYGGTNLLKTSAKNCPALAAAIAIQKEKKKFKDEDVHLEFNFIEISNALGWSSVQVRKELKSLEWAGTQFDEMGNATRFRKSGILVEFSDLAYRVVTPGNLSDEELDSLLNFVHGRNTEQERMELYQLYKIYQSLLSNSCKTVEFLSDVHDESKSENLKKLILEYFNRTEMGVPSGWKPPSCGTLGEKEEIIRQDIRKLLENHSDLKFSSRAIARIFQGIPSPCFPAEDWSRNRSFWRRHLEVDFHILCQIASQEIY